MRIFQNYFVFNCYYKYHGGFRSKIVSASILVKPVHNFL